MQYRYVFYGRVGEVILYGLPQTPRQVSKGYPLSKVPAQLGGTVAAHPNASEHIHGTTRLIHVYDREPVESCGPWHGIAANPLSIYYFITLHLLSLFVGYGVAFMNSRRPR
jgi:hypothetical protein